MSITSVSAHAAKDLLHDGEEVALLDVREPGEYAEGHPFLAVSVPISRFEPDLMRLVPRRRTRCLLIASGEDDREEFAARLATKCGYDNVVIVAGGTKGWRAAGFELFEGVHVPSKAFGELVEAACHVPSLSAGALYEKLRASEDIVILDGRPFDEHVKMNIPGSICLPNGELPYRIGLAVPSEKTQIVVHCAGRTRSIIGAQTLRSLGLRNPIFALENGTQGWALSGLKLEHGSRRTFDDVPGPEAAARLRAEARRFAARWNVPIAGDRLVDAWLEDEERTTYVFDVRGPEEYGASGPIGSINAPGGQLVQATDLWIAVRAARVVLLDPHLIRAVSTARWLRQMGLNAVAFDGARTEWPFRGWQRANEPKRSLEPIRLGEVCDAGAVLIDLRPSMTFRKLHIAGARWTTRGVLPSILQEMRSRQVVLVPGENEVGADLVTNDLIEAGYEPLYLQGGPDAWTAAGLDLVATPDDPPDDECIDHVFFTHDRHSGNMDAARRYLAWEMGLVERLDERERAMFSPG